MGFDPTTSIPLLILSPILAYLLGSIPFGIVVAKLFGLQDPREIGSGNIGATNVMRSGNKPAAALTLILDAGKGAFAVIVAREFVGMDISFVAGLFAFLGHLFPVYLGFKGGKGVATFLGILLAFSLSVGAIACAVWLVVAVIFRISSLSALVASASAPFVILSLGPSGAWLFVLAMAALVFIRHWSNISRLLAGTEPRIGSSK